MGTWVGGGNCTRKDICSDSIAALMALKGGEKGARPDLIVEILTVLKLVIVKYKNGQEGQCGNNQ